MTTTKAKVAGEVDGYCTRCRLMMRHRIVAMVGPKPARVECLSCGSQHNFRATLPGEKPERAAGVLVRSTKTGQPRQTASARAEKAAQDELEREKMWEKAISGKAVTSFKKYSINGVFQRGDLLTHSKFGDGVVTQILDTQKIEVLFKAEIKILAHAM